MAVNVQYSLLTDREMVLLTLNLYSTRNCDNLLIERTTIAFDDECTANGYTLQVQLALMYYMDGLSHYYRHTIFGSNKNGEKKIKLNSFAYFQWKNNSKLIDSHASFQCLRITGTAKRAQMKKSQFKPQRQWQWQFNGAFTKPFNCLSNIRSATTFAYYLDNIKLLQCQVYLSIIPLTFNIPYVYNLCLFVDIFCE